MGLLWLLLFPVIWPLIAKQVWTDTICYREMALNIGLIVILVAGVWYAGKYRNMHDTQILNGEITRKHRDHSSYIVTYPCNCHSCGKNCTTCSVCTTKHYTVDWDAESTAGHIDLDHADWTSPAVYLLPDPPQYKQCEKGQSASVEHSYKNYIKAVPESLFHLNPMLSAYDKFIPSYPRVFDYYKVNRVINIGTSINPKELNDLLNEQLKALGPKKQVNIVVILTQIQEPNYRLAVENAWLAGKKNDVIVYLGIDGEKITWADTTIWVKNTGNEYAAVLLRDNLKQIKTYDAKAISDTIVSTVASNYQRAQMEKFEYLLDEIQPPLWVVVIAVLLAIGGSLGLTYYFHKNEVFND